METHTMVARMRRRRDERGASAVEFALVFPIFVTIVFGTISFGIVFAQQLALSNSAREASRFSVVDGPTCADVTARARDASHTISMSGEDVIVSLRRGQSLATSSEICGSPTVKPCADSETGDSIFITVSYDSTLLVPLVIADNTFTVDGQGVFRCEYS